MVVVVFGTDFMEERDELETLEAPLAEYSDGAPRKPIGHDSSGNAQLE